MIQILLYVFLFLSESIRIWLRIERSITETYTHVRLYSFHMLRVWKMLCRRVSFERNHTNECESQSLFQTYLDYLRARLISEFCSFFQLKYENHKGTYGITRDTISILLNNILATLINKECLNCTLAMDKIEKKCLVFPT